MGLTAAAMACHPGGLHPICRVRRNRLGPAADRTAPAPPAADWTVVASGRPIHNTGFDCHCAGSTTIHPNQGYAT